MHTLWKGSIRFGLVNIPVKMYASHDVKDVRFRYLHTACQTPIKMTRMCTHCNTEVKWEDVTKGYEYSEGKYVIMEKDELEALSNKTGRTIEILDFVELNEIDPIYFNKTYYLGSQDENDKSYTLLREVLEESNKIGVGLVTIRSKTSLAVIRVYENVLVLETVYYPDEIRDYAQVPMVPERGEIPEKELLLARQLIQYSTTQFHPEKYTDEYRTNLREALEEKIQNEEVVRGPDEKPDKVVDLMALLKASLEETEQSKKDQKKKASS